ncbi:hypothetical protein MLD38_001262 [Melastoma candidum]|uniref:Uncharacterized protein n=1 Tax=Melastoma candidum TaxID=119954 RepID=A0ACB9SDM6_9MYRT|nr:hypothetical protein MLD38_001262 [Melastoma candidum]
MKDYMEQYEKDLVFKFLNGLNDEFSVLRAHILMKKPFPTLGETYNIIQQEEKQKDAKKSLTSPIEGLAMAVSSGKSHRTGRR